MHPGRRIRQTWSIRDALHRLIDGLCIVGAMFAVLAVFRLPVEQAYLLAAASGIIGFYLVAEFCGLYRSWRGVSAEREVLCAVLAWTYTAIVLFVVGFTFRLVEAYPRRVGLSWLAGTPVLIVSLRLAMRRMQQFLRARGFNRRGFAIIGVNDLAFQLARNIEESPELGLQLVGFYDDRPEGRTPEVPVELGRRIGDLDELLVQARHGNVQTIYITFPMRAEDRIRRVLKKLGDTTASVYVVPDFFVFELLHSRWADIGGLPVVSVFENPLYGVDGLVKRATDFVLASLFLAVAAVPMAAIALGVKLTSKGPVFFRQRRYGLDGREIRVWKFRTMTVCEDGDHVQQAQKNDQRITKVGAFLRKTSLDEAPQLFNVLSGAMSLVGPRPHAKAHNEQFRKMIQGYMLRHKVKPGITGLAQVNGCRGETETLDKMERRVQWDHRYIREWSWWMDVRILLKTPLAVLKRENAY